jgi:putative endonuclease
MEAIPSKWQIAGNALGGRCGFRKMGRGGIVRDRKYFCVYLLASRKHGTLYAGVTSNLARRLEEHRSKPVDGFTARYGIDRLVWYEAHENAEAAITREKQIKEWKRAWKVQLIEAENPEWRDLSCDLI